MSNYIIENSSDNLELVVDKDLTYIALNKVANRHFIIKSGATLNYLEVTFDSYQTNLTVDLEDENSNFYADTLVVGNKDKYIYNQLINHKAKMTNSDVRNYAISLGNANISFKTIGHILNKMIKSNCNQVARGFIISDDSKITSEPILYIDEYDVFAHHGAAIGKMNDDQLFYLMSRGLSQDEALKLLVGAIIYPLLDKLPDEIKEDINNKVEARIKL